MASLRMASRIAAMTALAFLLLWPTLHRVRAQVSDISMATADRVKDPDWWPTKGDAPTADYAPPDSCGQCHAGIAALQHTTPMYLAATPGLSEPLRTNPRLTFHDGVFTYLVERRSQGAVLSVTGDADNAAGNDAVAEKIAWTFGEGETGKTWLLETNGTYTEGRVSYYTALHALGITTGHPRNPPSIPELALGNQLSSATARSCFSCHTTKSTIAGVFNPSEAIPGVTCEACHGPGAAHVREMSGAGTMNNASGILNPALLPPSASVDFCGACHRTWVDVAMGMPPHLGPIVVRFQPYRLEESRCWGKNGDSRITCIACHDPHRPLVRDAASYDQKCLACHSAGARDTRAKIPPAVCRTSASHCVNCHMPKVAVQAAHANFTDHDIRIVSHGRTMPE
jgi:hypothetical protein